MKYFNGDHYKGEYQNGKKSGKGKYSSKGYIYDGHWLNDKFENKGELKSGNLVIYNGNWA